MILHFYFARRFLKFFLSIFTVFALFLGLVDLVEQLRRFDETVSFGQVVQITLLKLPEGLYTILPLVLILATVVECGRAALKVDTAAVEVYEHGEP